MIIASASPAGNFSNSECRIRRGYIVCEADISWEVHAMPRGSSTFNKRQKEHARQQRQRDKAERKNLRKQEKEKVDVDELSEMLEHAKQQAALFDLGSEDIVAAEVPERGNPENPGN